MSYCAGVTLRRFFYKFVERVGIGLPWHEFSLSIAWTRLSGITRGTVFPFGHPYAKQGHNRWTRAVSATDCVVTFALAPGRASASAPRCATCGANVAVELELPTGRPDLSLRMRICGRGRDLSQMQRHLHRERNGRHSGLAIAGMLLLLAVCGWIADGEDGVRKALAFGGLKQDDLTISPEIMATRFGVTLLRPSDLPNLFARLYDICRRAHLPRPPDLYYLPAPNGMNAYALGGPRRSAIVLTDGLIRRMSEDEVAGILAHEVAHISNNDRFAMDWATSLQRAVAITTLAALAATRREPAANAALAAFLRSAPSIGQLLYLALSRSRELDADARALDLIDHPQALATALNKLEAFHANSQPIPLQAVEDSAARLLRSHPATWERIGLLAQLAY
jgi:heat shock protein HtpX